MNIKGRFVTLRAIEEDDLEMLRDMLNDSEMEQYVVGWSFPVSKYQEKEWYIRNINDNANKRFIIDTESDGAVGLATLTEIDWKNKSAFHGIKLANKKNRAKGIGTDAVMAIMRYAFNELGLHRLDGAWFDDNIPSKRLYTKCGWSVEGTRRECIFKGGKFRDLSIAGILATDYYALIDRTHYWE